MNKFNRLKNCVVTNKNVLLRVDINVPVFDGKIEDDTRIRSIIPTLQYLTKQQAKVILISHFGRPEGKFEPSMSLSQLLPRIQELLGFAKVHFVEDCVGEKVQQAIAKTNYGEVIILENLRFYKAETKNDPEFVRQLANLGHLYVNDAFSCSHRAHASITGLPSILKSAAGFLMEAELDNLSNLLGQAKKPMIAIVGGAKVSTKIDLLNSLSEKAQTIVVGGGMANSFLFATGKNVGRSLCEKELKETALKIIETAKHNGCRIILPEDVVVTKNLEKNSQCKIIAAEEVADDEIIADIGPISIAKLTYELLNHQTALWNGPLGAFEIRPFNIGSESLARAIASLTRSKKLLSIAGGGDVVSALSASGLIDEFTYISTAGGAFLEWLEGKELPGVSALRQ